MVDSLTDEALKGMQVSLSTWTSTKKASQNNYQQAASLFRHFPTPKLSNPKLSYLKFSYLKFSYLKFSYLQFSYLQNPPAPNSPTSTNHQPVNVFAGIPSRHSSVTFSLQDPIFPTA
ncbi:MAG: hypothetical protein WBD20_00440 [Pirellulaceae bacterium]